MSILTVLFVAFGACLSVYAEGSELYIYGDPYERTLELPEDLVGSVRDADDAVTKLESVFSSLLDEQKSDPDALDSLALLTEILARRCGASSIDHDAALSTADVRARAREASRTIRTFELLAEKYGVVYPRVLRREVMFKAEDMRAAATLGAELNGAGADRITIDAGCAALTIDAAEITGSVSVSVGYAERAGETTAVRRPAVYTLTAGELIARYWSIGAALLITLGWLAVMLIARKRLTWLIPVIGGVSLICVNVIIAPPERFRPASNTVTDDALISASLSDGLSAILSIPTDAPRPDELVILDGGGKPAASKYNRITGAIEARIDASGTYSLGINPVYFTDVEDKSEEMKYAIYTLTSRGLMNAAGERNFLPDREITRAEFLSVVLNALHLADTDAEANADIENPFPDVLQSDWFYSVAAAAHKEGLIEGYADGTFRGNSPIPKGQMIVIAANCLARVMRYHPVDAGDMDSLLARYGDLGELPDWARPGIASATRAGVILYRADGLFDAGGAMSRGDAAIVLYRVFGKIW
jgi:hypothetical protein